MGVFIVFFIIGVSEDWGLFWDWGIEVVVFVLKDWVESKDWVEFVFKEWGVDEL